MFADGNISCTVEVGSAVLTPGASVPVTVSVRNLSSKAVSGVTLSLIQHAIATADEPHLRQLRPSTDLSSMSLSMGLVGGQSSTLALSLSVPPHAAQSTTGVSLTVSHDVVARLSSPWAADLVVTVPVTVARSPSGVRPPPYAPGYVEDGDEVGVPGERHSFPRLARADASSLGLLKCVLLRPPSDCHLFGGPFPSSAEGSVWLLGWEMYCLDVGGLASGAAVLCDGVRFSVRPAKGGALAVRARRGLMPSRVHLFLLSAFAAFHHSESSFFKLFGVLLASCCRGFWAVTRAALANCRY
jgi:arrestin (S-antigen)-like protein